MKIFKYTLLLSSVAAGVAHAQTLGPNNLSFINAVSKGRSVNLPAEMSASQAKNFQIFTAPGDAGAFDQSYIQQTGYLFRASYDTFLSMRFKRINLLPAIYSYIEDRGDTLGLSADNLIKSQARVIELSPQVHVVVIPLQIGGVEVHDSFIEIQVSILDPNTAALRSVKNKNYSSLQVLGDANASVSLAKLKEITGFSQISVTATKKIIFPKYNSDSDVELVNASKIDFVDLDSSENFEVFLRSDNAEVLQAFKNKVFEAKPLEAKVLDGSYLSTNRITVPLDRTPVTSSAGSFVSDKSGMYDAEPKGEVTIDLKSTIANIFDTATNKAISLKRSSIDEPVTATDNELRALNAYSVIHRVSRFARTQIKASESSYFDRSIRVSINYGADTCNAYYDGNIMLYREAGGCANMALVNSVIAHEWGHGLDNYTGRRGGMADAAFSEGIGDILAAYFGNSSNMGAGFFLNREKGIRSLENTNKYPGSLVNEPHTDGLIIGGAFWDLRKALIERYGDVKGAYTAERLFLRHLLTADTYRESYDIVISLDDDDGNPATRSPNFCLISAAFAKHGLSSQAACQDSVPQAKYPVDATLTMGFVKDGVALSTKNKNAMTAWVCLNGADNCSGSTKLDFKLEGKNASRHFFTAATPSLADMQELKLFIGDESGTVLGARKIKATNQ